MNHPKKTVRICRSFLELLYVEAETEEMLDGPSTKFDNCGFFDGDGNVYIPSKKYKNA